MRDDINRHAALNAWGVFRRLRLLFGILCKILRILCEILRILCEILLKIGGAGRNSRNGRHAWAF